MSRLDLVRWVSLDAHADARGTLVAIEGERTIPFAVRRVYFMYGSKGERAGHAHRDTQQLLIPAAGSCEVRLSDGRGERAYTCDDPARGLLIAPMLYIRVPYFSSDAVVLVVASTHYDKSRSIRSWNEYLEATQ